jgi:hypothetical protein
MTDAKVLIQKKEPFAWRRVIVAFLIGAIASCSSLPLHYYPTDRLGQYVTPIRPDRTTPFPVAAQNRAIVLLYSTMAIDGENFSDYAEKEEKCTTELYQHRSIGSLVTVRCSMPGRWRVAKITYYEVYVARSVDLLLQDILYLTVGGVTYVGIK